ncbi:DUF421 domain-containing protein [Wukongibacter baidiensis]|uniref:DUF421 domain-containing protein n=1 Tax=Wukongibacter baidiensis TaxID=1723361 RepID=UPI003D7F390B
MTEIMKEISIVLIRIVTILPLLLFVTLFMGKRAIGELPVFDYLIIITLGSVTGADIADPDVKQIPTIVAIISIGLLQRLVANLKISNRKIGHLITFEPTVVIQDGKFINKNLKKNRYSIDNILNKLREKDIFDISEVETAIIEATGNLSVLKKAQKNPVTLEDMGILRASSPIAFPIIMDGTIYSNVLKKFNLNEAWLYQELSHQGISNIERVFYASINSDLNLHVSLKDDSDIVIPPIR